MAVNVGIVEVGIDVQARQAIQQLQRTQKQFGNVGVAAQGATRQINKLQRSLVAVGAATGAAMFGLIKLGRASFKAAADVSEMDVAMTAVNKSLGLAPGTINTTAKEIRSMGIEMKSAQEMALLFAQGNLDMAKASKVARVAQDLAVLSQSNSTETARTLAYAIQTGNSRLLKSAGITKYAGEAYAEYAASIGKTEAALTATERQTAVLNMILEEGTKVAGTYEAAMLEPGKVLRSFPRLLNDMQIEFGNVLKEGFGPAIKAAYDLTKALSKTVREGGVFNPVLKDMGVAFGEIMAPLTSFLKSATDSVKHMNRMGVSIEGAGEKFKQLLPVVGAASTALSLFAGRNILQGIPVVGRFANLLGGPVVSAFAVFAATNEDARSAVLNLLDAAQPALELITTAVTTLAEAAIPLVNALASVTNVITELPGGAKALATVLAVLIVRKKALALGAGRVGTAVKAAAEQFKYMRAQVASANATFAGTGRAMSATSMAFRSAAMSAKAFMASIAPMLAVTAAITAAFALFDHFTSKSKAMKERTEEFTVALRQNTDAILENKEALESGAAGANALEAAFLADSEGADKLLDSLGGLNTAFDLEQALLAQSEDGFASYAQSVLEANGASSDLARAVAMQVAEHDKNNRVFADANNAAANYALAQNMSAEATDELLSKIRPMIENLEEVQDQFENIDLKSAVDEQINFMVATEQATVAQVQQARALAEAEDGYADLNEETQAAKVYLALVNDVLAENILKWDEWIENAKSVVDNGDLLVNTVTEIEDAIKKTNEGFYQTLVATGGAADGFTDMEKRLELLNNTIEEPTLRDFVNVMMAADGAAINTSRSVYEMNKQVQTLMNEVARLDSDTDSLVDSMYNLYDQFQNVGFTTLELGGSVREAQAAQVGLINTFIQSAEAAGYSRDAVIQLINELGILDTLDPQISIAVGLDLSQLQKQLDQMMSMYIPGVTGMSGFAGSLLDQMLSVKAVIDSIEGTPSFSTRPIGGGTGYVPGVGDVSGGADAADELAEAIDRLAQSAHDLGETFMTRDFATSLLGASPQEMVNIFRNMTGQLAAMAEQAEAMGFDGSILTNVISELSREMQSLTEMSEQAAEQMKELALAQEELARRRTVFDDLTASHRAFRIEFGLPVDSPGEQTELDRYIDELNEAMPRLLAAQRELDALTTAQARVQERVKDTFAPKLASDSNVMAQTQRILSQAREFRDNLIALRDRGFPADVIAQVAGAGLQGGARLGRQLLRMSSGQMSEFLAMRDEIASLGVETATVAGEVLFGADIAGAQGEVERLTTVVDELFANAVAEANGQFEEQKTLVDNLTEALETTNEQMADLVESIQLTLFNAFNNFLAAIGGNVTALTTTPISLTLTPTEQFTEIIDALRAAGVDVGGSGSGGGVAPAPAPAPAPSPAPAPTPAPDPTISVRAGDGGFRLLSRIGVTQNGANMRKLWEHNGLWFDSWRNGQHQAIHPGQVLRIPAFAMGGRIRANQLSLIGENGPELFAPSTGGTVIPNHAIGGKGDTYNITINTHAGMRAEDIVREIEKYTRRRGQLDIPTTGTRRF